MNGYVKISSFELISNMNLIDEFYYFLIYIKKYQVLCIGVNTIIEYCTEEFQENTLHFCRDGTTQLPEV